MAQYRQQYGGGFSDSRGGHHHQGLPDWHRPHHASSKPASRIRRPGKPSQRRRSPAAAAAVAAALLLLAAVFLISRRISRGPTGWLGSWRRSSPLLLNKNGIFGTHRVRPRRDSVPRYRS